MVEEVPLVIGGLVAVYNDLQHWLDRLCAHVWVDKLQKWALLGAANIQGRPVESEVAGYDLI